MEKPGALLWASKCPLVRGLDESLREGVPQVGRQAGRQAGKQVWA